jgi:hypothetical protein
MVGVTITASPRKDGEFFTDMHAYSTGKKEVIPPSWHLTVKEVLKPDMK